MADKNVITKPAGRALLPIVVNAQLRKDRLDLHSADTVRLQVKVVEGNREHLQPFGLKQAQYLFGNLHFAAGRIDAANPYQAFRVISHNRIPIVLQ